jgi:hypothetical protein
VSNSPPTAPHLPLPIFFLGSVTLEWKDLVIDGRNRFRRHVTKICSEVYATLQRLRLLKFLTPKRMKLCKVFILPLFLISMNEVNRIRTFCRKKTDF